MAKDEDSIVESLIKDLELSRGEAALYLRALREKALRDSVGEKNPSLAKSLQARGMLILAANGKDYHPVHPRLAISNLFRTYEEKLMRQRKEKRQAVDKLTLELIPIYEESKGTNSTR